MMQEVLYKDGVRQSWNAFRDDANEIADVINETWQRTEYDTAMKQVIQGALYQRYRDDKDLYPFWEYIITTSLHPRDEHLALVGKIFQIGDPEGDLCMPQNGWNCGCRTRQVDDLEGRELSNGSDWLDYIDPQFRFNPADQGILPKNSHSYFEALPSANEATGVTFGLTGSKSSAIKLGAKGMHMMLQKWYEWQHKYHSDHNSITFQNEATLTNVVFTQEVFNGIQKHSAGFDHLADTITNPEEIWAHWDDVDTQMTVKRVYMKDNYLVFTKAGIVQDAYLVDNVNHYRKGVLI